MANGYCLVSQHLEKKKDICIFARLLSQTNNNYACLLLKLRCSNAHCNSQHQQIYAVTAFVYKLF